MSEVLREELPEHLRLVEEQISREAQDVCAPRNFYRLSLLTRERARVRRHIEQLDEDEGDAA